jgi:hypothetical protein
MTRLGFFSNLLRIRVSHLESGKWKVESAEPSWRRFAFEKYHHALAKVAHEGAITPKAY